MYPIDEYAGDVLMMLLIVLGIVTSWALYQANRKDREDLRSIHSFRRYRRALGRRWKR